MALQQLDLRPQEGFNQIFTELVNNEIVNAPYNPNYSSKYFFFKKRKGISSLLNKEGYDFLDYVKYVDSNGEQKFLLTRRQSDNAYEVFDIDGNSVLEITDGGITDMFVKVLGGGEHRYDEGQASSGDTSSLTDDSKSRDDNELAGYYIYLYDGTGAGQLRYIQSNTSDTINVGGFDVAPDSTTKYIVYTKLVDNIVIPYNNGVYRYDGEQWVDEPIFSGYKIKGMCVWNSRLWYVSDNQVIYSEEGDYYFSKLGNELIISNLDVNNLYGFGNYLFVTTPTEIGIIYKSFSTTDGTEFFVIKEGLSQVGVKNRFGIGRYRDTLYFIATDGRLYSVGVQSDGNEATLKLQDNGTLPANFISQYYDYDIKLYSDINYLYLFANKDGKTYEIYYDDLYKGWLNNEYECEIINKKFIEAKEYVFTKDNFAIRNGYTDLGNTYGQVIRLVVGEPDIFMWKDIKYINLLLGKTDYIQNGILTVTAHLANKKFIRTYNLANTKYISDLADVVDGTYGGTLIGNAISGGDLSVIQDNISDVDLIKVGIGMVGQIVEFDIDTGNGDNGILFGGIYVYYNGMNPIDKYYGNVI